MKKRTSKLEGSPIELLNRVRDDEKLKRDYFYWDSPVVRALHHLFASRKPPFVYNVPANCTLLFHRGTGCSSYKNTWVYSMQFDKDNKGYFLDYYVLEMVIYFYDNEEERDVAHRVEFNVPFDLEENFTEEKFNDWANKLADELKVKKEKAATDELKALMEKYPEQAKKLLAVQN